MLELPNNFSIKNTKHCYEVGCRKKDKNTNEYHGDYISQWFFTTLHQAVNFCIDRGCPVPKNLELLSEEIENLKLGVAEALKNHTRPS